MTSVEAALASLHDAVRRLDAVLIPWGFQFRLEANDSAHDAFAVGWYERESTRIGLIWRARTALGCVNYSWAEVRQQGYLRERVTWEIGHPALMRLVGHGSDCQLAENGSNSAARSGGDPVAALVHDLREYAVSVLAAEGPELAAVMRRGRRIYEAL